MSADPVSPSRRERLRTATLTEIKATALQLMREHGTPDVRFSDIARRMGLTAPALYRYYADRDELLTDLIADGYRDLAETLAEAVETPDPPAPAEHLLLVAQAFRTWALNDLHQFTLIFGQPVAGYRAPENGPTVVAAKQAMANLSAVVLRAAREGRLGPPLVTQVDAATAQSLGDKNNDSVAIDGISLATHQAMMLAWGSLHGFVCLEAYGHLDMISAQAREGMYRRQVELIALSLGL